MCQFTLTSQILSLVSIMMIWSCQHKPDMKSAPVQFHEYATSDNLVPIQIIYAVEGATCRNSVQNANVYKAKVIPSKDTVYVFEFCKKPVVLDSSDRRLLVVRIYKDRPSNFLVPATINIPENAECLFGEVLITEH